MADKRQGKKRQGKKRQICFADTSDQIPESAANSASKRSRTDAGRPLQLANWTNAQVVDYLKENNFDKVTCDTFRDRSITGKHLICINQAALFWIGITEVDIQSNLLKLFGKIAGSPLLDEQVFNDPIHGHIKLHPLLLKIIDTPQFQRLRRIKQLGGAYYVFPGASHNRFEHSIGVGHLAREFVENLQHRQPELGITAVDCLCVSIAGLCHDLGHGPFSHMFDNIFMKKAQGGKLSQWKHEQGSVDMFDHLMAENNLWPEFERYELGKDDVIFIKELIVGPKLSGSGHQSDDKNKSPGPPSWNYRGRPVEKSFLYEIVANKRNGIDVDKWDYFARDCHCLGIPNNFDQRRYVKFARVIEVDGVRQICCRDKEVNNLYEMFHTRAGLHRRAYQHKTSKCVELMVSEALLAADEYFSLPGKKGNPVKISDSVEDMHAFTRLHDGVLDQIMVSQHAKLEEAKELLSLVESRQLYKYIGQTKLEEDQKFEKDKILKGLVHAVDKDELKKENLPELTSRDLLVEQVTFDYGMKEENPIDQMRFYTKEHPDDAFKIHQDQVSQFLPRIFIEKHIRVYSRSREPLRVKAAQKCFETWCFGNTKGDFRSPYATPIKKSVSPDQRQTVCVAKPRNLTGALEGATHAET